jgi:hypothetical protein
VAAVAWFSIEISSIPGGPARTWAEAYGDVVVGVALAHGASGWDWIHQGWGSVLEIELPDDAAWEAFRQADAVRAALEEVPDPVNGLLLRPGRGGSAGSRQPSGPRPLSGSGSAALPIPEEEAEPAPPAAVTTVAPDAPPPAVVPS